MKKFLAIVLALVMIFSLASLTACGDKEEKITPENTENTENTDVEVPEETEEEKMERLTSSKPNEYVAEKLEAGMEVTVALLAVEFGASAMQELDKGFREGFEAAGYSYTSSAFNLDTAVQISSIENYVTMGVALIITMSFDDSVIDTVHQAMEAGTYMAMWGSEVSYEVSVSTRRDSAAFGKVVGDMLNAWAEYAHPDEVVKAALLDNISNPAYIMTVDGIKQAVEEGGVVEIVYEAQAESMDTESGFSFAENAYTSDSGIQMFIGMTFAQALGMNNFVISKNVANIDDYGVFAYDKDELAPELLADEGSAFRGYASVGGENQYSFMLGLCLELLNGELEPGTVVTENLWAKTDFGYEYSA